MPELQVVTAARSGGRRPCSPAGKGYNRGLLACRRVPDGDEPALERRSKWAEFREKAGFPPRLPSGPGFTPGT
jgi:hypothetical protein